MEYGLLGLLVLILDIFAIVKVVNSKAPGLNKIIWVLVILIFPVVGLIAWWLVGPKS